MATHSSVLAWRIPGTGEPGGLPSLVLHRGNRKNEGIVVKILDDVNENVIRIAQWHVWLQF